MWNRIFLIYLIVCAIIMALLSMHPANNQTWIWCVIITASFSYPFFLVCMRLKTGFWKGAFQLLLILVFALLSSFGTYLLWYAYYEFERLGSEFHLLEALGWTFGESFAFFLYLDVVPAAIITSICYPVGYLASFQIFRLIRNDFEQDLATNTPETSGPKRETS